MMVYTNNIFKGQSYKVEQTLDKLQLQVPTVLQRFIWDCGLACVCMVLRFLGLDDSNIYATDHKDIGCGESVWTIDLSYLLKKYGINTRLTTTTLGVDEGYRSSSFYKESFTRDENRINRLFQEAESHGIIVEQRSIDIEEMIEHMSDNNLIIILVDWNFLECIWCDKLGMSCLKCLTSCSGCLKSYQGHYIILCGFSKKKNEIYYKNPSYDKDLCCTTVSKLDKARKSYGTDEDTLFIFCER